jgi:hypothetical protein
LKTNKNLDEEINDKKLEAERDKRELEKESK